MPHKRSQHKIIERQLKSKGAFSGIKNLFSGPSGLMQNDKADSIIQHSITKSSNRSGKFNLRYGKGHQTSTRIQNYIDAQGVHKKRVIIEQSIIENVEKDYVTDKIKAAQLDTGKIVTDAEIQKLGLTWSGFLQQGKKEFRITRGIKNSGAKQP